MPRKRFLILWQSNSFSCRKNFFPDTRFFSCNKKTFLVTRKKSCCKKKLFCHFVRKKILGIRNHLCGRKITKQIGCELTTLPERRDTLVNRLTLTNNYQLNRLRSKQVWFNSRGLRKWNSQFWEPLIYMSRLSELRSLVWWAYEIERRNKKGCFPLYSFQLMWSRLWPQALICFVFDSLSPEMDVFLYGGERPLSVLPRLENSYAGFDDFRRDLVNRIKISRV